MFDPHWVHHASHLIRHTEWLSNIGFKQTITTVVSRFVSVIIMRHITEKMAWGSYRLFKQIWHCVTLKLVKSIDKETILLVLQILFCPSCRWEYITQLFKDRTFRTFVEMTLSHLLSNSDSVISYTIFLFSNELYLKNHLNNPNRISALRNSVGNDAENYH